MNQVWLYTTTYKDTEREGLFWAAHLLIIQPGEAKHSKRTGCLGEKKDLKAFLGKYIFYKVSFAGLIFSGYPEQPITNRSFLYNKMLESMRESEHRADREAWECVVKRRSP